MIVLVLPQPVGLTSETKALSSGSRPQLNSQGLSHIKMQRVSRLETLDTGEKSRIDAPCTLDTPADKQPDPPTRQAASINQQHQDY
jgi:hypothetical protein